MKLLRKDKKKIKIVPFFERRYIKLFGSIKSYEKFLKYINTAHIKAFRINTLKVTNPMKIICALENLGLIIEKNSLVENSYIVVDSPDHFNYFELEAVKNGEIYIQDASSMLVPTLMDIPEEISNDFSVLDIAAAPGSKTTQIAELMNNRGLIVANDVNSLRIKDVIRNVEQSDVRNVKTSCNDGRTFDFRLEFDRILVDVPCSGTGTLRKNKESLRHYSVSRVKVLQENQLKILNNAFKHLKKGGLLVYSTCSLEPEENELCIKRFLGENINAELIMTEIPSIEKSFAPTNWFNEEIPSEISKNVLRILPQKGYIEGFFIARIRKIAKN